MLVLLPHPRHATFTGVECLTNDGIIKANLKIKYEDFILDYRVTINDDQEFDKSGKFDTTIVLLRKYLDNRLQIFADDKILKGKISGLEPSSDELNLSMIYSFKKNSKSIKIRNTILTDVNKSQSNLLIFKCNEIEEGVTLTPENAEHTFRIR